MGYMRPDSDRELKRAKEHAARRQKESREYRSLTRRQGAPNLLDRILEPKEKEATQDTLVLRERNDAAMPYLLSLASLLLVITGLAAFLPLVALYLLYVGFRSRHSFVRWHTAQWTLLTLVALFVGIVGWGSDRELLVIAVGGWYLGNLIGARQANRGDCWLWRWLYDTVERPRPWAVTPDAAPATAVSAPSTTPTETLPSPVPAMPASAAPAEAQSAFAQGMDLARQGQQDEAVTCFITAFRDGPPYVRRRAVQELEKLGEVDVF